MITFSALSGDSGVTVISITADSTSSLVDVVNKYTLNNTSGHSISMPVVQRAYVPIQKYIEFSPSAVTWSNTGGTGTLQILSNDDWRIVADGWIMFAGYNEMSGNGNTIIGISCSENTGSTRTGGITGYCLSNTALTATTSVQQTGGYSRPYIELDYDEISVEASGLTGGSIVIDSNIEWVVNVGSQWITASPASGSNSGSVIFNITENEDTISRISDITISNETYNIKREFVIRQSGAAVEEPYIIINPTGATVPLSGDTFSVDVYSNTSWDVLAADEWITANMLNGEGNDKVRIDVDSPYEEITGRTGYVYFVNKNEDLMATLEVLQTNTEEMEEA